jgi:hypothetical protein
VIVIFAGLGIVALFIARDREKEEVCEQEVLFNVTWPDPNAESETPNPRDARK